MFVNKITLAKANTPKALQNKTIVALIAFLVFAMSLQAQETFVRKISFLEGLPTQVIYDLHIAPNGLLYMGTNKGLISFNGVEFTEYEINNNIALSISEIKNDATGKIWCKNFSNQLFFLKDNQLHVFEPLDTYFKTSNDNLISYYFDENNELHVLTEIKLLHISKSGEITTLFSGAVEGDFVKNPFNSLDYNPYLKELKVASSNKIFTFKNNSLTETTDVAKGQKEIALTANESIYTLKGFKNQVFTEKGRGFVLPGIEDRTYFYHFSKIQNELWLATSDGIHLLDIQQKKIDSSLLRGKRISDIVEDLEGNRWVSSLDDGLYFIANKQIIEHKLTNQDGSVFTNVISIALSENNHIFAGTSTGEIIELDQNKQQKIIYKSSKEREIEFIFLDDDKIFSSAGLFQKNKSTPIIDNYLGKQVAKDNLGNYMIASYNRAGIFSDKLTGRPNIPTTYKKENISPFLEINELEIYIFRYKRSKVVHFCNDTKTYFIGSSDGFFTYDLSGNEYEIRTPNNAPIIVSDLQVEPDNSFWIATGQSGIMRVIDGEVKESFTENDGLSNNKIIKIQNQGNYVWIATTKGFDRLDKRTKQIENFNFNLGFKGITINNFLVDRQNILWFATNKGLISAPASIFSPVQIPSPRISAKNSQNSSIQCEETLPYKQSSINFTFETNFFKSLGDYQFEYRILPLQNEWQQQSSKVNTLSLLSLGPGNYQLEARLKSGKKTSAIEQFSFSVKPPYWQSIWFIFLSISLLLFVLFIVYRSAVEKTRNKEIIKEQLAISQLTALRTQMNPHFMFNVLNAVQGLIYSNQKIKANEYLGTFSELMRKTLDISDKREVTIEDEIETIKLYVSLEASRFEDGDFEYSINIPKDIQLSEYTIPSLIIQPFVENAIKHGLLHKKGKKILRLSIREYDANCWAFEIIDNGIGRKASYAINEKMKKHVSFATNATETRIELMNKLTDFPIEIRIEDLYGKFNEALGTKITLLIPKNRI